MPHNALYIQSGGPTAVINASGAGVIRRCQKDAKIGRIYAARHGIKGVLTDDLVDCSEFTEDTLKLLEHTPAMAFGSTRYTVQEDGEEEYQKILAVLSAHDIRYLFLNGGNGTAKAAMRLSSYLEKQAYEIHLVMIPKTVDNDIALIDHAPGFPSAARHVVITTAELIHDMQIYDTPLIMAVEVMGRNTGFLAAATKAAELTGFGPDLIYVPEVSFTPERLVEDVRRVMEKKHKCFVVVPEGVKTPDGKYLFEDTTVNKSDDPSVNMGGITPYLSKLFRQHFSCKIRCIDLGLMQRCAAHTVSPIDLQEAGQLGEAAVEGALNGWHQVLVTHRRISSEPYRTAITCLPLKEAAGIDAVMDTACVTEDGCGIREEYLDYILPLIGPLPVYAPSFLDEEA